MSFCEEEGRTIVLVSKEVDLEVWSFFKAFFFEFLYFEIVKKALKIFEICLHKNWKLKISFKKYNDSKLLLSIFKFFNY